MFVHKSSIKLLIVGLLIIVAQFASAVEIQKSPNDNRQYESFTLKNGLRVFLVSDPELELAAASLNVQVGSFHEPQDRLGLAHFLEHMLFMGTKKYPDPAEYTQYVIMHGGYTNAWTGPMNTQYYFSIMPQYLPGALDRFAQFFVAPNFDADLVDRERNAVNSEYQLHLKEDGWRLHSVSGVTGNTQHPISQFHIGSRETLSDTGRKDKVRDRLLDFYQNYYSADRMILVIAAPQNIAELKDFANEYFSEVPQQGDAELEFMTPAYTAKETGKVISVQTIGDHQVMQLVFPLPPQYKNYDKQSLAYILYLINQAGAGSLQQSLKDKNWIVDLQTHAENITYAQDEATISFTLTEDGSKHIDDVVSDFFAYIQFLQHNEGQSVFNDLKAAGERNFTYPEALTAEQTVTAMPELIQHYPIELVLKANSFSQDTKYDLQHIRSLMGYFTPKNMRMMVLNNKVQGTQFEKYFQVAYTVADISSAQMTEWENPKADSQAFKIPKSNPYMPADFKQKPAATIKTANAGPQKVLSKPGISLWFKQDQKFKLPKQNILLLLSYPDAQSTARRSLLQEFMLMSIRDNLHAIDHDLLLAGVGYDLSGCPQGLVLSLNMFSDKEAIILKSIIDQIKNYKLTPTRFVAYKEDMGRALANFKQHMPYKQAMEIGTGLITSPYWLPQEMEPLMPDITPAEVESYTQNALKNIELQILIHGNMTQRAAAAAGVQVEKYLHSDLGSAAVANKAQSKASRSNIQQKELINLSSGSNYNYVFDPQHSDGTIFGYLQGPTTGDQAIATNALLCEMIRVPFFEQLRTNEQLGYVVGVSVMRLRAQPGLIYYVESPERKPAYLQTRIMEFCKSFEQKLHTTDPKEFENFKHALQHNLLKQPTSLSEETARYWEQITAGTYRFDFNEQIAKQVGTLTLPQVANYYHEIWLNPNTRKQVTVLSKDEQPYPEGELIENIDNFRKDHVYTLGAN